MKTIIDITTIVLSAIVGVLAAMGAMALGATDGWALSLGLVISFGIMLSSGVFNVPEEPKHHRRHMTIAEGLRYRKVA